MTDDVERQLDEFYRKLDPAARRVEQKWKPARSRRALPSRSRSAALWITLGVASAAAVLLILLYKPTTPPEPATQPVTKRETPAPKDEPPKREEIKAPEKTPDEKPPEKIEEKKPPQEEKKDPDVKPPDKIEEKKPERETVPEKKTDPEPAFAIIATVEGTWSLGGKAARGPQKDVRVQTGDRMTAATVCKLVLAQDRFVLLAPKTEIEFRPEPDRLVLALDQGELIAELIGAGTAVRVLTKTCQVDHVGTVFSVRLDAKRTIVSVEEGTVECRGADTVQVATGQAVTVAPDGKIGAPALADFRRWAWARAHRPAERMLITEDFTKAGKWEAILENGIARGVPDPDWCVAKVRLEQDPVMFRVPVRGRIEIKCRADRPGPLNVQIHAEDPRLNFLVETRVSKANTWETLSLDFTMFQPTEKSKRPLSLRPGQIIDELYLMYGDQGGKGTFWVDSVAVIESRP